MLKQYRLISRSGEEYFSDTPGELGGNRGTKIYGRLDCKIALTYLAKEGSVYADFRVFFANEQDAISAGYRPCAVCMPVEYQEWKAARYIKQGANPAKIHDTPH